MNIAYSEMPFSTNSFHVETSQSVCFPNQLIDFYMIWGFNEIYFETEPNSICQWPSITYLNLLIDEI